MDWKDIFSTDLDKTLLVLGGIVIALYIVYKIFGLHDESGQNSIISPEIIMALINIPTAMFAYGIGKSHGSNGSNGGTSK